MLEAEGGVCVFGDTPLAYGHCTLRTWDRCTDELLRRAWETEGELDTAIRRMIRDGYRPRLERARCNLVADAGFNLLLSFLAGTPGLSGLQYVALGTDNTPPTGTETQLPDEQIRLPVASMLLSNNQLTVTGYFDETQGNVTLGSAALFGNGATDTPNSGTIYSYVTYNQFDKNNLESLTVQWTLGFQRQTS